MEYLRQLNKPADNFVMIPNRLCQIGLTPEAIGYMVHVALMPGDFVSLANIERATGLRKKRRQRIQRELIAAGLLHMTRTQDPNKSGQWSTTYVFDWSALTSDRPTKRPKRPKTPLGAPVLDTEDPKGRSGTQKEPEKGQKGSLRDKTRAADAQALTGQAASAGKREGEKDVLDARKPIDQEAKPERTPDDCMRMLEIKAEGMPASMSTHEWTTLDRWRASKDALEEKQEEGAANGPE